MRTTLKRIFIMTLTVILLCCSAFPCFAAEEKGIISVTLEDKSKNKINGVTVYLCQVAELNNNGYYPTTAFEGSGISISGLINSPDESSAKSVTDYIKSNQIEVLSLESKNGIARFSDLALGIWVVFCAEDSKYTFNPYIVFLPFESGGKLYYEVSSVPKIEDSNPNEINIYVVKKWDDKNNAAKKRPDSVNIQLLNGSEIVSTAKLSESNGWSHTFTGVSKDGNYSVKEKKVENYTAQYNGDALGGFIVTNSYNGEKLPQTGQLWWPIVIISVAGIAFVLLGIIELGARKNGKKNK